MGGELYVNSVEMRGGSRDSPYNPTLKLKVQNDDNKRESLRVRSAVAGMDASPSLHGCIYGGLNVFKRLDQYVYRS